MTQAWNDLNVFWDVAQVVVHFHLPVPPDDVFGSVLVTLQSHVFSRVASANDKHIQVFELLKLPQLMTVRDFSLELFDALEIWQVRIRIMTSGYNNKVKQLSCIFFLCDVCVSDLKLGNILQKLNVSGDTIKLDELVEFLSFKPFEEVCLVDVSGQVGGDRFAKMFVKGIVRELEDFFGQVGPELTVHAGVNMFAVLVSGRTPAVVPLTTPCGLLVNAGECESGGGKLVEGLER
jgi:hypothetical protein